MIEAIGYDPERDVENTADSVFCSHGAGVMVPWDQVPQHAQVDSGWRPDGAEPEPEAAGHPGSGQSGPTRGRWRRTRSCRPSSSGPTAR